MAKTQSPKSKKSKKSKRKNKMNIRQVLMVGLMLLAAIAFIFSSLPPDLFRASNRGSSSNTSTATTTNSSNSSTTTFIKEGELTFLGAEGVEIRKIDIQLAENKAERDLGLMYRRSLPEDSGMLFYMDENKEQSFWMKNTYISLDIIYISEDKEIVSIAEATTPLSESPIPSNGNAKYVLEVIAGYCATHNIKVGDKVDW